ncbi:MAG TPA: bifunctional demethylmenaquinone methyltransferase/2-methoxy-6-polyprenyl-1,4-benzoquinol methylase UbiE [Opitutaceae bacterium]|nr:bifunctional demethylmenaquinone methyltransferase/2-methoxy-6-polyprenyl-1,4-benzoquinol methylase UbiE [Opitutaceae bacterium]
MPDPVAVNSMFARIARRYDVANHWLSGGIDRWWRRKLVAAVRRVRPHTVLDLATGSGDVAFALARGLAPDTNILGMDFCQPMLDEAEAKKAAAGGAQYARVRFQPGDGMALPLADASFDAVTIAFGLRNMADRHQALGEMRRVLRPGGSLFVLEFSQPYAWFRPWYLCYLRRVLPRLAQALTGDRAAYVYLNETIEEFPDRPSLAGEIAAAGFARVRARALTFGIAALHEAGR